MPVNFNAAALDAFRNASLKGDNAIANIDANDGKIRQAGSYKGKFIALFRMGTSKDKNNAVRTELLRSLGQAFGIEGVSEKYGKVKFSDQFMDKLEQILGKDFKRSDFGIASDGTVSSGKPLTQRRIAAILNRATLAGKAEFDLSLYEAKLTDIKAKINNMPPTSPQKSCVQEHFKNVETILNFLKNEIDGFITKNEAYNFYVETKNFREIKRQGLAEYDMYDATTDQKVPMKNVGTAITYLQKHVNQLFHLELNAKKPELVTNYIKNEMEAFVKLSVDLFYDSIQTDNFELYATHLIDPGACMEDQTKKLLEFQEKFGLQESIHTVSNEPMIATDRIANHDKTTILSECIFREIDEVDAKNAKKGVTEFNKWEQYRKPITDSLVGLERPLVTATKNTKGEWRFTPVLDENNQPVIKKLTVEDIEKIGPACVEFVS